MENDICALARLAQAYFDAAHGMDAEVFASLFHPSSSVSSVASAGDDITVSVTPIAAWLTAVRAMQAPRRLGLARRDEILSIDAVNGLASIKLTLQIPPRYFTDMLSCAKIAGAWRIVQKVTRVDCR